MESKRIFRSDWRKRHRKLALSFCARLLFLVSSVLQDASLALVQKKAAVLSVYA